MRVLPRLKSPTNQGFALIEVLTTILVVSFGLIGLAGMGVVGLRNNHMSYYRSIATQQAYDMSDRMRANITGVQASNYNNLTGTATDPGCIATGCSSLLLAQYDQYAWNAANAALLPSGAGTVTGTPTTNFAITVSWTEICNPTTDAAAGCTSAGGITRSFSTTFVP